MSGVPDVTGYPLALAREVLNKQGIEVEKIIISKAPKANEDGQLRVVRMETREHGAVLTVCWFKQPLG